jgi:hypothetical protein
MHERMKQMEAPTTSPTKTAADAAIAMKRQSLARFFL